MDFKHLSYFICVVEEKSFTRAAKRLHISQPALSKMIKNLEEELGIKLLMRNNTQFELTEFGTFLYEEAKEISKQFESLTDKIKNFSADCGGAFSIGLPPVIGTCLVSSVLDSFNESYPEITINVSEDGAKIMQQKILTKELDIGFTPLPVKESLFDIVPLYEEEMEVIVNKKHALANRDSVTLEELQNEKFVIFNNTFVLHDNIINACKSANFEPKIIMQSSNWDYMLELVAKNRCITVLPKLITRRYSSDDLKNISISNKLLKWEIAIVSRKGKHLNKHIKKFINFIIEHVPESLDNVNSIK